MSDNQDHQQLQDLDEQQQIAAFPNLDTMLPGGLTQEQAMAFQQFQAMHGVLPVLAGQFPRPTVKRRKPVKWEIWEEKNLIEGVRRFGRGNWAQIRAAFEFNPCRTNVDLHDKWRVLTGERKRNRQRPDTSQSSVNVITAEIPAEGQSQKVQLVPVAGTNGLYTLASPWSSQLLDGQSVQFPPEFLQQLQQGELLSQGSEDHVDLGHDQQLHITEDEVIAPMKKKQKKKKEDEDEIAQELLKLSSPKQDENLDRNGDVISGDEKKKKRNKGKK